MTERMPCDEPHCDEAADVVLKFHAQPGHVHNCQAHSQAHSSFEVTISMPISEKRTCPFEHAK